MNHRKLLPALSLLSLLGVGRAGLGGNRHDLAAGGDAHGDAADPDQLPRRVGRGQLSGISVVGSASGRHRGRLRSYASATGASFLPSKPFTPGEHVTVRARWSVGRTTRVAAPTHFTVAAPGARPAAPSSRRSPGTPADVQSFQIAHRPAPAGRHRPPGRRRRQRAGLRVRRSVPRPGAVRADDLRQRRQSRVVPPAAGRPGRGRLPHADLPRQRTT